MIDLPIEIEQRSKEFTYHIILKLQEENIDNVKLMNLLDRLNY